MRVWNVNKDYGICQIGYIQSSECSRIVSMGWYTLVFESLQFQSLYHVTMPISALYYNYVFNENLDLIILKRI